MKQGDINSPHKRGYLKSSKNSGWCNSQHAKLWNCLLIVSFQKVWQFFFSEPEAFQKLASEKENKGMVMIQRKESSRRVGINAVTV